MINPGQRKAIHTLRRELGLSEEDYRGMLLDNWNASSSSGLTFAQADELIDALRALGKKGPRAGEGWKKYEDLAGRPGMATPAQLRKIEATWWGVSQAKPLDKKEALDRFLMNRFQVRGLLWLERKNVQKVIKALDEMVRWKREAEAKAAAEKARVA